jgi:leucyl aminopeptidase
MPFPDELRALLNSDIADMMNSRVGNPSGGMLVGGLFLKEFVGKKSKTSDELIPWVHLDLAGPADNDGPGYGFIPKGATGSYVRSLVALAEAIAK